MKKYGRGRYLKNQDSITLEEAKRFNVKQFNRLTNKTIDRLLKQELQTEIPTRKPSEKLSKPLCHAP